MERSDAIALTDPALYPDIELLRETLGGSLNAYQETLKLYDSHGLSYEWRYYNDGKAWLCKVHNKKKTIVWMSAWKGFMKATIYFPERYLDALKGLPLSPARIEQILGAKNVGKSRPCTFDIKEASILVEFETLIKCKLSVL